MHNVLFAGCQAGMDFELAAMTFTGEHITAAVTNLWDRSWNAPAALNLTNSILIGTITNGPTLNTNGVVINPAGTVFQIVGAGSAYLADSSPYRNAGTTNISPALLGDLRHKTTYPPIVYSNTTISVATTFSPQAQRETGAPDLGWAYDPVDFCFGGVTASSNLSFSAGTVAAWFELPGNGGPGYGIGLGNGVTNTFNGTATAPCIFARYDAVQEG